jgi:hypothetical protein
MNHDCMTAKVDFYAKDLSTMLSQHFPVFMHSDLQRKNVLVYRQPDIPDKCP